MISIAVGASMMHKSIQNKTVGASMMHKSIQNKRFPSTVYDGDRNTLNNTTSFGNSSEKNWAAISNLVVINNIITTLHNKLYNHYIII